MEKITRALLPKQSSLIVQPALIQAIGLNAAMILQQIHYFCEVAKARGKDNNHSYQDGHYWTYNSVSNWQEEQFPWLSTSTIQAALKSLEKKGMVVTGMYNRRSMDRTKWYRVDYSSAILASLQRYEPTAKRKISYAQYEKETPLPEGAEDARLAVRAYVHEFNKHFGKPHKKLPAEKWQDVVDTILTLEEHTGRNDTLEPEDILEMAKHYFTKQYNGGDCDYSIVHFNQPGIKEVNFWKAAY